MKKILVIQTAFIGDVILATGVLETLNEAFPDAKIDFLVRKGNHSLLQGHPFVNRVLIWFCSDVPCNPDIIISLIVYASFLFLMNVVECYSDTLRQLSWLEKTFTRRVVCVAHASCESLSSLF